MSFKAKKRILYRRLHNADINEWSTIMDPNKNSDSEPQKDSKSNGEEYPEDKTKEKKIEAAL